MQKCTKFHEDYTSKPPPFLSLRRFCVKFLSTTTVLRVHSDGDFVVEGGRELLDVALGGFARLRIRCIVAGRCCRVALGNSLNGRPIFLKCKDTSDSRFTRRASDRTDLIESERLSSIGISRARTSGIAYPFSLSSEVGPLQSRGELVLQPGHDRAVAGRRVVGAAPFARLLRQEVELGRLLGLAFVRPYPDRHLTADGRFRAVGRRGGRRRDLGEFRDRAGSGVPAVGGGLLERSAGQTDRVTRTSVRHREVRRRRFRHRARRLLQFEGLDALHFHRVVVAPALGGKRERRRCRRRYRHSAGGRRRCRRRRSCRRSRGRGPVQRPLLLLLQASAKFFNTFETFDIYRRMR